MRGGARDALDSKDAILRVSGFSIRDSHSIGVGTATEAANGTGILGK